MIQIADTDVKAMDHAMDRIYRETDRDFCELAPTDDEYGWLQESHAGHMTRIREIEANLSYSLGREAFVDLLGKWQKNIRFVLKAIRKKRTDPFDGLV